METNKFSTMLHKSTNRFTQILIYAFLEWILILLLLLNSTFSYLVRKFADIFGLVRPCPLCSRIDHIIDRQKPINLYLCETHAYEISKLGYCSAHRKLAESRSMCSDCSGKCITFLIDSDEKVERNGEADLKCSCCNSRLNCSYYSRLSLSKLSSSEEKVYPSLERGIGEHREDTRVFYQLNFSDGVDEEDDGVEVKAKDAVLDKDEEENRTATCGHERERGGAGVLQNTSHEDDEAQHLEFYIEDDHLQLISANQQTNEAELVVDRDNHYDRSSVLNSIHEEGIPLKDDCTCNLTETRDVKEEMGSGPSGVSAGQELVIGCEDGHEEGGFYAASMSSDHFRKAEEAVESHDSNTSVLTIKSLKSALEAKMEAMVALYAELERERSASAEAASHTMAMINKLQKEKAAMQMEALQYQRMMEEQSEYDQEALQLLNDLVVKREKEKQELEREMDVYRKKVMDYEMKEKMMLRRRDSCARSKTSTASCGGDSDGRSVGSNDREEDDSFGHEDSSAYSAPRDTVVKLDKSLAGFEQERLYILEQLRILEGKLTVMAGEEERDAGRTKLFEQINEDGDDFEDNHLDPTNNTNMVGNGILDNNESHWEDENPKSPKSRRRLPTFGDDGNTSTDKGRVAIEEELDELYDRLQALQADIEFLRHCVGSLKKGDKGINLLGEILEHLRDLRNVELCVRNLGDDIVS